MWLSPRNPGAGTAPILGLPLSKGAKTRITGRTVRASSPPARRWWASRRQTSRLGAIAWSKSGTLTYQMMYELRDSGSPRSIRHRRDPVIGNTPIDAIRGLREEPETSSS